MKIEYCVRIMLFTLVVSLVAACGGGGGGSSGGGSGGTVTAPTVVSTSPANTATNVSVNAVVTATFSETMDASTITTSTFTLNNGNAVPGVVAYSGTTATFTPATPLSNSSTYTATLTTGVKNTIGTAISSNYVWTFTTADVTAASGMLDTTFNSSGTVPGTATIAVGSSNEEAYGVAIQPTDSKIVMAGYSSNGSNNDFAVVRYNTDGTLDTSFNATGKVTTAIGAGDDTAYCLAIQSTDGKIVVGGYSNNGTDADFALVRYNADGSLDTSFGTGGKVTTAIGSGSDYIESIAIQSDGKIVAAGETYNGSNYDFAVARYNTDGSLDTSFGSAGKATRSIGTLNDKVHGVALQSDGKIVVVGESSSGYAKFALARFNTNGSVDTSFGSAGVVITSIGSYHDFAFSVVINPSDGKIIAAGQTSDGSYNDFALAKYNTDGSLDTAFGTGGKVVTPVSAGNDGIRSAALQSDGKIIAAGSAMVGLYYRFALARYNSDGSLDTAFGSNGEVTTAIGTESGSFGVALQPDGAIVAAGRSSNGTDYDFAVARYK